MKTSVIRSSIRDGPDPGVSVKCLRDAMDDLLSMLEQCGKDVINEDDYNMSVVEDMVTKLIDMKNAIQYILWKYREKGACAIQLNKFNLQCIHLHSPVANED